MPDSEEDLRRLSAKTRAYPMRGITAPRLGQQKGYTTPSTQESSESKSILQNISNLLYNLESRQHRMMPMDRVEEIGEEKLLYALKDILERLRQ